MFSARVLFISQHSRKSILNRLSCSSSFFGLFAALHRHSAENVSGFWYSVSNSLVTFCFGGQKSKEQCLSALSQQHSASWNLRTVELQVHGQQMHRMFIVPLHYVTLM